MAAKPRAALVNIQAPKRYSLDQLRALYQGIAVVGEQFGFSIIGGGYELMERAPGGYHNDDWHADP